MRISFDRQFLPLFLDYSLDVSKYTPTASNATSATKQHLVKAQRFLTDHKGIKLCGILGNNCRSARCAYCSKHQARQYLSRIITSVATADSQSAYMLTLTIENKAAGNLSEGYRQLNAIWQSLTRSSWLLRHCEGFARSTEVVFNPSSQSWNLHIHLIISCSEKHSGSPQKIIQRWIEKAYSLNIFALASSQHSRPVEKLSKAVSYTFKDFLSRPAEIDNLYSDSLTPGALLTRAASGDARAAELFSEWETASKGHRVRASGGTLKAIPLDEYRELQQAKRDAQAPAGR